MGGDRRGGLGVPLPGVGDTTTGGLVVAYDVLGGQFAWMPGPPPTVHSFAPDELGWEDLGLGYGDWLEGMLSRRDGRLLRRPAVAGLAG